MRAGIIAAMVAVAGPARAERPAFEVEPLQHDGGMGHVRVHYVTSSADAVPSDDEDDDGTPDYVEEVAALAEVAWVDLGERGFRPPVADLGLVDDDGGDGRFDIYLVDFANADGHFVAEACTPAPVHCTGYFTMENDLAGFGYASRTEGISVLTSHELFHAVQAAYVPGTAVVWSEGTAVWNEEKTFPEQADYERFVAEFLARPERPFDRAGSGGDSYSYGAALWPTFLDERYGDGTVRRAWERYEVEGEDAHFLDVIGGVLADDGVSITEAWTEFSRWNLFTGERADPTRAYEEGAALPPVAAEPALAIVGAAETSVEGFSARYLPIQLPAGQDALRVEVAVDADAAAAFFPIGEGDAVGQEVELTREEESGLLVAPLAESGMLVLTSMRRAGLPRAATIEMVIAPSEPEGGGCQAARSGSAPGSAVLLLAAAALLRCCRRRYHDPGGSA